MQCSQLYNLFFSFVLENCRDSLLILSVWMRLQSNNSVEIEPEALAKQLKTQNKDFTEYSPT